MTFGSASASPFVLDPLLFNVSPGDFASGKFGCAATAPCVRGVIMNDPKMS